MSSLLEEEKSSFFLSHRVMMRAESLLCYQWRKRRSDFVSGDHEITRVTSFFSPFFYFLFEERERESEDRWSGDP